MNLIALYNNEEFMNPMKRSLKWSGLFVTMTAALLLAGCQSSKPVATKAATPTPVVKPAPAAPAAAPAAPAAPVAPVVAAVPKAERPTIRIKAGLSTSLTDADGNVWLPDQGFVGGDTIERADLTIANTKSPGIYRSERYSMTGFSREVPNGKYIVKLHFAETYEGITAAGERVFSFNVEGHEVKDFDVFAKAGGSQRAYIETINADVTDGKLDITFTSGVENPEINGIEIIPKS
jgi:hypothetical protein